MKKKTRIFKSSLFEGIPFFASVAMYCYEGAGLVLSLEHASFGDKTPQERKKYFPPMFIFSIFIITSCYIVFGLAGYAAFGDNVQAVITKNLGDGFFAYAIKGALSIALFLTYPVVMHPVGQIFDTRTSMRRFTIRVILVVITIVVVIFIPSFATLMELIGGSACSMISFILPALFHFKLSKDSSKTERMIDLFIVVFGTAIGITCTAVALSDLNFHPSISSQFTVTPLKLEDLEYAM